MLQPIIHQLNAKRIILASGSPRRQEILRNIGLKVELCPSLFEENLDINAFTTFGAFVEETALHKVLEVAERLKEKDGHQLPPDIIIGADTMVTLDGQMYGKPKNSAAAFKTLTALVGKVNVVYTGVVIKYGDQICRFTENANVHFGQATPEQIQAYVDTGEPLDKAGGYGIQNVGATFIEKIDGDFYTVMGLPLHRLSKELWKLFHEK